jgi:hypothetical protein
MKNVRLGVSYFVRKCTDNAYCHIEAHVIVGGMEQEIWSQVYGGPDALESFAVDEHEAIREVCESLLAMNFPAGEIMAARLDFANRNGGPLSRLAYVENHELNRPCVVCQ